jgi:hypothetical protein
MRIERIVAAACAVNSGGSLDPGYPLPGKIRQAQLPLPKGTPLEGVKLKAELEVKGVRYPLIRR